MKFYLYVLFCFTFFLSFDLKLICLLLLESMFILTLLHFIDKSGSFFSFFFIYVLGVFMVLDSVLGISILVSSSRSSSQFGPFSSAF